MKYTAGQAADATGLSTATITRAIKKGRISALKDDTGAWSIDPSELHRVFPPVASAKDKQEGLQRDAIPSESLLLQLELETVRERLKGVEVLAAERAEQIADLRARLDTEAEERRRLTALLAHYADKPAAAPTAAPVQEAPQGVPQEVPREAPKPRKRSWWSWARA